MRADDVMLKKVRKAKINFCKKPVKDMFDAITAMMVVRPVTAFGNLCISLLRKSH